MATGRRSTAERAERSARRRPAARSSRPRRSAAETSRSTRGRRPDSARERTRTRPTRRKALRRRVIAALSVLTAAAAVYVLLFTSLLGVRSVEVIGNKGVRTEAIVAAADVPDRRAMLRLDTDVIRDRVLRLAAVADADVSRSWPSTIEITVTERTPIGFYNTGEQLYLVDGEGVVFKQVPEKPQGLPELKLARVAPDDPATDAVTAVLATIPPQLRERVTVVEARTAGSVELTLADGKVVRWGDSQQADRKAKVLAALMTREGKTYDVSSPELPTIS